MSKNANLYSSTGLHEFPQGRIGESGLGCHVRLLRARRPLALDLLDARGLAGAHVPGPHVPGALHRQRGRQPAHQAGRAQGRGPLRVQRHQPGRRQDCHGLSRGMYLLFCKKYLYSKLIFYFDELHETVSVKFCTLSGCLLYTQG